MTSLVSACSSSCPALLNSRALPASCEAAGDQAPSAHPGIPPASSAPYLGGGVQPSPRPTRPCCAVMLAHPQSLPSAQGLEEVGTRPGVPEQDPDAPEPSMPEPAPLSADKRAAEKKRAEKVGAKGSAAVPAGRCAWKSLICPKTATLSCIPCTVWPQGGDGTRSARQNPWELFGMGCGGVGWHSMAWHGMAWGFPSTCHIPPLLPVLLGSVARGRAAEPGAHRGLIPAGALGCCKAVAVQTSLADTPRPSSPTSLLQCDLRQCCLGQGRAGGVGEGLWALLPQHGALWCLPTPQVTPVPFGLPSPQEPPCEDEGGAPQPGPRGGAAHLGRAHPQQVHPGGLHRRPAQRQLPGAPR